MTTFRTRDLTLTTDDDVELAARWHEPAAADPTAAAVVVVHGLASSLDDKALRATVERLVSEGHRVLAYDARGHGRSGGLCTLGDDERFDVAAAWREAAGGGTPVVIVGASMGGIATLRSIADGLAAPDGCVIVSSPARWQLLLTPTGIGSLLLTRTPPGRALARRWMRIRLSSRWANPESPVELARRVRVPVGVVHGTRDRFIPARAAGLLASALDAARVWLVDGMGHSFSPAAAGPIAAAVCWTLGPGLLDTAA